MLFNSFTSLLMLLPVIVSAAIFPPDSKVKTLDPKGFKRVMKSNVRILYHTLTIPFVKVRAKRTSVVAFVAPWCGVSYPSTG